MQRAKKVVSDSPGLVDFATGIVNSVLNFPDRQVKFFGEFSVIYPAHQKKIVGRYNVTLGLVNSSYSLPERQAVNLRICSCLACIYRVMDARGKFGEHQRCVRVALGCASSNSSFLRALQTSQVHYNSIYAQLKA